MAQQEIKSQNAPKAIGPYSQGVSIISPQKWVYVSGQIPLNPTNGEMILGDIQALTRQTIKNMEAILNEGGAQLKHVVRVDIFLVDMNDFSSMNQEYDLHFQGPVRPTRQVVEVRGLPKKSKIEMSCIAAIV